MARRTSVPNLLLYSFAGFLILPSVCAQLLSCAEINCPLDSYSNTKCQVNGSDLLSLGYTNFTTSLAAEPLSWTVGYTIGTTNNTVNGADERIYYLGTPPQLDLNSITSISGCALSFVGVEAGLSFVPSGASPKPDINEYSGTCDDALGTACVSDLIQQSQNYTNSLTWNSTFQCSSLAEMLKNNPPASCNTAGTWGNIVVKDLTGAGAPSKIQLDQCHPTANQTYDIRILNSAPKIYNHDFFNDITPIMTVFAPASIPHEDDVGPFLSTSEAHLSCMKPLANKKTAGLVPNGANTTLPKLSMALSLWALLCLALW